MTAGGSAYQRAQQQRDKAAELGRQARAAHAEATRYATASKGERLVYEALLVLQGQGWRLLADRQWPGTRSANVDMIMIGPGGVYIIDVKSWRDRPVNRAGHLYAGTDQRDSELHKLRAMVRPAEDVVSRCGMSPIGIHPIMVFTDHHIDDHIGRVRLLGLPNVRTALMNAPRRLRPAEVDEIAVLLEAVFPAYDERHLPDLDPATSAQPATIADSLFDVEELAQSALAAARAQPLERWMTFLDPSQLSLVRRDFRGPARISGAAGTGKSVVGLHRAIHLAKRTTGKILFTTLVTNLPKVQASLLAQVEPAVANRIECVNLHAWARDLGERRHLNMHVDTAKARTAFAFAWKDVGRSGLLADIDTDPGYWQDEITYVIKGRGLRSVDQYLAATRFGRHTPLRPSHREHVWALYEEYERQLRERQVHDHADLLLAALHEARRIPVEPGYEAVLVDEVQDLTLTGIRLLHTLTGDKPNGLLLIGDCRQSIYPGGYRLADAGVSIVGGRASVLTVNYRNAPSILNEAMSVIEDQRIDDIDGTTITGRPAVEAAYHEGTVTRVVAPTQADQDTALVHAVTELTGGAAALANTAVLCTGVKDVEHYRRLLAKASIATTSLDSYDGTAVDAVKVGTVRRGKGLEFAHVFLPNHNQAIREALKDRNTQPDRLAIARHSLHVAITRARETLWLGSVCDQHAPEEPAARRP